MDVFEAGRAAPQQPRPHTPEVSFDAGQEFNLSFFDPPHGSEASSAAKVAPAQALPTSTTGAQRGNVDPTGQPAPALFRLVNIVLWRRFAIQGEFTKLNRPIKSCVLKFNVIPIGSEFVSATLTLTPCSGELKPGRKQYTRKLSMTFPAYRNRFRIHLNVLWPLGCFTNYVSDRNCIFRRDHLNTRPVSGKSADSTMLFTVLSKLLAFAFVLSVFGFTN